MSLLEDTEKNKKNQIYRELIYKNNIVEFDEVYS